jgi:hypothetical protein
MRRSLVLLVVLFPFAALAADAPEKGGKAASLKPGTNLPGPFYPYNVTGPHKGHFHSFVSEHGLEPAVLVFHRGLEVNDAFRDFLKQLDAVLEKNVRANLAGYVVFIAEDLPEVFGADDKNDDRREELAAKLEDLAKGLMLKHVIVCLDSKSDVEKYGLGDEAVTVILYRKLQILASHALARDQVTEARVKEILGEVTEKLGARRKK